MLTAFIYALVIVGVTVALAVVIAAWLDKPHARHRLDGDKTASYFRSLATETPAPGAEPGQAPDAAPAPGAAPLPQPEAAPPVAAYTTGLGQPASPAPLSGAPEAAPRAGAAVLPAPPQAPVQGAGQHAFDGHRERKPWYIDHGPSQAGRLTAIGYGPFDTGPRAIITSPTVNLRATGAHAAVEDGPAAAVRPYAEQWWVQWDRAVNEP